GTDQATTRALRRYYSGAEAFPSDVMELLRYFEPVQPGQPVQAVPGAGLDVPVWILGSSLYGAQLAAALGLPYAFASHFAPAALSQAIELYRRTFRPSPYLDEPYVMLGVNVIAADSDAEARRLFTSLQQMFARLRSGNPGKLAPPVEGEVRLTPPEQRMIDEMLSCSFVGSRATVQAGMEAFALETGADELIVASQVFD